MFVRLASPVLGRPTKQGIYSLYETVSKGEETHQLSAKKAPQFISQVNPKGYIVMNLANMNSKTIPSESVLGALNCAPRFQRNGSIDLFSSSEVVENSLFRLTLQSCIAEYIHVCPETKRKALVLEDGWLPIRDLRAPEYPSRATYPEQMFGVVRVEKGQVVPGSYSPNAFYVLSCAIFGLPVLPSFLHSRFIVRVESSPNE